MHLSSSTWIEQVQSKIPLASACLASLAVCYSHFLCFHAGGLSNALFPRLPFNLTNRKRLVLWSPMEKETVAPCLLFAPGTHLQDISGQRFRRTLPHACICVHVWGALRWEGERGQNLREGNLADNWFPVRSLSPLYSFSAGAVTNYDTLSDLKQEKFIVSQFWSPDVQNQYHWIEVKVLVGLCYPRMFWGRICFFFQRLLAAGIPWLMAASLHYARLASSDLSALCLPRLLLSCMHLFNLPLLLLVRTFVMAFRAHLDNLPVSRCLT